MRANICADWERLTAKPDRNKTIDIANRIPAEVYKDVEISEIADKVSQGHTFTPALFDPPRKRNENVKEMQIFGLDFDDGYDYEYIRNRFMEFKIPISFSYHTLSSKPEHPKFRIAICHIVPIKERWMMELIESVLKRLFPEADKLCFDISRMFFGGKELIECNADDTFRVDELIREYQEYEVIHNKKHCTDVIRDIAKKAGVLVYEKKYFGVHTHSENTISPRDIEWENRFSDHKRYILSLNQDSQSYPQVHFIMGTESDNQNSSKTDRGKSKECRPLIQRVGKDVLRGMCALIRVLAENSEDISHDEHLMIATNLIRIKGMKNTFLDWLEKAGSDREKWAYQWQYLIDHNYQPERCDEHCRFCKECRHKINILLTAKKAIYRTEQPKYVSTDESYKIMYDHLVEALKKPSYDDIILIPGQPGIGKTHAYLEAIRRIDVPVIIAAPTVELKNEIAGKAGYLAQELVSLKDLLLNNEQLAEVQGLYDAGFYREAREKLKEYKKKIPESSRESHERIDRYLKGTAVIEEDTGNLIMTHSQLMHIKEDVSKYTVIVDEDILYTIFKNTRYIKVADVQKALDKGWIPAYKEADIRKLIDSKDETFMRFSNINCDYLYITQEEQLRNQCYGNINDLICAGAGFIFSEDNTRFIQYFTPNTLPMIKIIVMSATLSEDMYRRFFRQRRIVKYEVPPAKYKGKLIQYTHNTMSRSNIKELIEDFKSYEALDRKLFEVVGADIQYEIGFKKYLNEFKIKDNRMNFGATTGIDMYKGKNGLIVGTPHMDEKVCKLIACYLGVDVTNSVLAPRRITHKGFSFCLMTYKDEILRNIQLYFIDSELEQAVGRSRLLREECSVFLFSNYPCEQAEIIEEDYLKQEDSDMPKEDMPDSQ